MSNATTIFEHDCVKPLPSQFKEGYYFFLPAGSVPLICGVAEKMAIPHRTDGSSWVTWSLAGNRQFECDLALIRDEHGERMQIVGSGLAGLGLMATRRAFRVMLHLLHRIKNRVDDPNLQSIFENQIIGLVEAPRDDSGTVQLLKPWDPKTPAATLGVMAESYLPVAVNVRSNLAETWTPLLHSSAFLTPRDRTLTHGLRLATREKSRIYMTRQPVLLKQGDKSLPYVRFAHIPDDRIHAPLNSSGESWLWEVRHTARTSPNGPMEVQLFVDGLAITDGLVAYGPELLTLLEMFCWSVKEMDPSAEFTTTWLRVPTKASRRS